ncbi:hypothetical protein [Sphingobium yanoikuyae]|uniref:hypothetical protein n=1 Tax=Sphingobium yanoikuyae TaxID=13690 RepID=UPI0011130817|nr:hypothetical protein [Sphingobium yanoikuyae]MDG2512566.1 hypothetical protein [Sphingobium yanoikuyae]
MNNQANWHWAISNLGPDGLFLWLEPWADEIEVPSKSTATFRIVNAQSPRDKLDVEDTGDQIIIWASGGDCIEVDVDGIRQVTGSATIPVPEEMGISTKELLGVLFSNQPTARLAGQSLSVQAPSIWQRIRRYLSF